MKINERFFEGKKVLIPGGLGMIGSNLAAALADLNAEVTIVSRSVNPKDLAPIKDAGKKIKLVKEDVTDKKFVEKSVKGKDIVIHCAAHIPQTSEYAIADMQINRISHIMLLEALRKFNDKAIAIFPGSRLVYGAAAKLSVKESHALEPLSFYGIDKLAAERYYALYYELYGIKTIRLRITNPYGKASAGGIVNMFIRKALNNETLHIFGDGRQLRDYIYVGDLVDAIIILASKKNAVGDVFNVGSGKGIMFREMAELVIKTVNWGRLEHKGWPSGMKQQETGDFVADITKLKRFGWKPRVLLADGLRKTVAYYKLPRGYS